jgi:hypothetical protein
VRHVAEAASGRLEAALCAAPRLRAILSADALRAWTVSRRLALLGPDARPPAAFVARTGRGGPRLVSMAAEHVAGGDPTLDRALDRCARRVRPDLIYLYVSSDGTPIDPAALPPPPAGYRRSARPTGYRYSLELGDDFETLLERVSYKTRRNLRRARRSAAKDGLVFEWREGPPAPEGYPERLAIGRETRPVPKTDARLRTLEAFLRKRDRPVTAAVHAADGRLLSPAAGFIAGPSFYLVYQVNDGRMPAANLALTLRGLLASALIDRGVGELVFPNGVGGVLSHACVRQAGCEVLFERTCPAAQLRLLFWGRRRRFSGPEHRAFRRSRGWGDTK